MNEAQLRELNDVAKANAAIAEALRAITDPQPEDVTDEWLNGPKTYLFAVRPGDNAWLPVGEYLLQIYADNTVTMAWREKVGGGSWGQPVSGERA
jgi:hypothetical protein